MSLININNLQLKLQEKFVLNKVNLNLNSGDRCILVGINGSGKSCFLRVLAGMHIVKKGSVVIDNKTSFQDQCNGIAFLGESWSRSVAFSGHSVAYQADIKVKDMMKKVQEENHERKKVLYEVLGINPEWRMHLVSSGQRRRVRLLLGLLKPFKVALIDEMTMDLDIITRVKFMKWLKNESIQNNACIIYATHIFDGLTDWGTHVAHMKPKGILDGAKIIESDIMEIAYKYLYSDYEYLKNNNISEKEDGDGYKELKRSKNRINGPQGGYGSGRLVNFS